MIYFLYFLLQLNFLNELDFCWLMFSSDYNNMKEHFMKSTCMKHKVDQLPWALQQKLQRKLHTCPT